VDFIVQLLAEQRASQRCIHADIAGFFANLIRADYPVFTNAAGAVLQSDPGTKIDFVPVGRCNTHNSGVFQTIAQIAHTPVDFPQALFTINIFSVFRPVTECGCIADLLGYPGTFITPEKIQFLPQTGFALCCQVIGFGGSWRSVAAHPLSLANSCMKSARA